MSRVLIHPSTYENVKTAVERVFELFPLDLNEKKVLIKPNVLRASSSAEGITTHPAVLAAVVEKVKKMQPSSIVVGDNPGLFSYGDNERSFEQTGLLQAAGGYYRNIGESSKKIDFNPEFMKSVSVSRAVLEADVVISLPKFKTHGLTVITGAIKNSYGILPGAQKAHLHRAAGNPQRFHSLIVDVFMLRIPDLFIMDGIVGMEGNGPASPDLRDVGVIVASNNAVAMDAVVARMMGLEPGLLHFMQKAKDKGLGDYNSDQIEIIGELNPLVDWKLPPLGGEAIQGNAAVQELMNGKTLLRPVVDSSLCTACGTCVDHCAMQALSMGENDIPVVDADTCITCFCCQEMCPEKAITL